METSDLAFNTNTSGYGRRNLILDNNNGEQICMDPKLYKELMTTLDEFFSRHKNSLAQVTEFINNWQKLNEVSKGSFQLDKADTVSSNTNNHLAYLSYAEILSQHNDVVTEEVKSIVYDLVVLSDFVKSRGVLNYQLSPEVQERLFANGTSTVPSNNDYDMSSANINVLLLMTRVTIAVIDTNSSAAKVAADSAQLLNRVLNALSVLSELLAQLNAMYGTGLSAKQKDEISKGASANTVDTTISWDDLVNNTKGDYTPDNNMGHFNDTGRTGFFIKSGSELLAMLSGMFGGTFDYFDKFHTDDETNYYWDDKKNEWVEYTTKIPDPQQVSGRSGEDIFKEGYIFIDRQTMQSVILYISQLVALALPSSSGNPNGDLVANFGNAWDNNVSNQSIIDAVANSTKQIQGLLSSISSTVSLDQAAISDMLQMLRSILSGWEANRNMMGV